MVVDALFETSFRFAPIGMAIVGLDGRFVRVNPALCEIIGYPQAELETLRFQDITYEPDLAEDLALVQELLDGKRERYQLEKRYIRKDGSLVWIRLTGNVVRDGRGAPVHFVAQIEDIDAQRKLKADLERQALLHQTLLDAMAQIKLGVTVQAGDKLSFVNQAYLDMIGYTFAELIALPDPLLVIAEEERDTVRDRLAQRLRGDDLPTQYETVFRRKDGTTFPAEVSVASEVGENATESVALISDITDRRKAELETKRQMVTRKIVRRILREATTLGEASATQRRSLGRRLAAEARAHDHQGFEEAFAAMHIGTLEIDSSQEGRWEARGVDMLEVTPGTTKPTCHIALGFLEGMGATLSDAPSLGTETTCQSQGHPACKFVIMTRPAHVTNPSSAHATPRATRERPPRGPPN